MLLISFLCSEPWLSSSLISPFSSEDLLGSSLISNSSNLIFCSKDIVKLANLSWSSMLFISWFSTPFVCFSSRPLQGLKTYSASLGILSWESFSLTRVLIASCKGISDFFEFLLYPAFLYFSVINWFILFFIPDIALDPIVSHRICSRESNIIRSDWSVGLYFLCVALFSH